MRKTDLEHQPTRVFFLPKPMDQVHLHEVPDVWVKGGHEKINIVQVVELPAFSDERVSEEVSQGDGVGVGGVWQVLDPGELER